MIIRSQVNPTAVTQVLNEHRDFSRNGFDFHDNLTGSEPNSAKERQEWRYQLLSPDGHAELNTACEYILSHDIPDWWGSYTLKHEVERWGRKNGYSDYISKGSVIIAAILCGFSILREENSPNCTFPEKDDDLFHRERQKVG